MGGNYPFISRHKFPKQTASNIDVQKVTNSEIGAFLFQIILPPSIDKFEQLNRKRTSLKLKAKDFPIGSWIWVIRREKKAWGEIWDLKMIILMKMIYVSHNYISIGRQPPVVSDAASKCSQLSGSTSEDFEQVECSSWYLSIIIFWVYQLAFKCS